MHMVLEDAVGYAVNSTGDWKIGEKSIEGPSPEMDGHHVRSVVERAKSGRRGGDAAGRRAARRPITCGPGAGFRA